jgi:hypothetical protein
MEEDLEKMTREDLISEVKNYEEGFSGTVTAPATSFAGIIRPLGFVTSEPAGPVYASPYRRKRCCLPRVRSASAPSKYLGVDLPLRLESMG